MLTVPTGPDQSVSLDQIEDPYRARAVIVIAELDFLKEGKVFATAKTSGMVCFEHDFFPGLVEFLKKQGVKLEDPTPAAAPGPIEP